MRKFEFRRYAPLLLLAALVITPLAIWAATSGGSGEDKETFYVERSVGVNGEPELLVTVDDPSVEVTNARSTVEVECTDAEGKSIVKGTQPWPFALEQGFPPHAHVAASEDEVQQARRCRVTGTNKQLVADVR
ncbi:MAG TPA: hypothetical protein VFB51_03310 [Solirubrobacterales bacterium]|nr:hypothetical protein [Solirubrobacterales bacterium]